MTGEGEFREAVKFSGAQIAFILCQANEGTPVAKACRKGAPDATFCNWMKRYDGLTSSEVKRMRLHFCVGYLCLDRISCAQADLYLGFAAEKLLQIVRNALAIKQKRESARL